MLLHPANFLLLDEPTNHLDMRAKDVLLEALSKYTGTVVFVSHDRYFIDKLSTRVFEIGEGRVEIYPGNYEDYVWRKQGGAEALQESVHQPEVTEPRNGNAPKTEVTPAEPEADKSKADKNKRLNPIKRKQMEDRFHEIEEEIVRVEAAIGDCETSLLTFVSAEETQRVTQEVNARREELQALMAEWEELGRVLQA